jgi:hypothetical protein
MPTLDILKSSLLDMPRGHIFDLTYNLFADVFPLAGEPDAAAQTDRSNLSMRLAVHEGI